MSISKIFIENMENNQLIKRWNFSFDRLNIQIYLETASCAIFRYNTDVWGLDAGTDERAEIIVPQISHL